MDGVKTLIPKKEAAKKLIKVNERFDSLKWMLIAGCGQLFGLEDHVGSRWHNPLGASTCVNSPLSSTQLVFALAASRHPLVDRMAGMPEDQGKDQKALKELVRAKVLEGMRIIDLGCGPIPGFARCARAMGADIYTVDIIPAEEFDVRFYDGGFGEEERRAENSKHISLDLRADNAIEAIASFSGGKFDIVTSAHLGSGLLYRWEEMRPPMDMKRLAIEGLLKDLGFYYEVGDFRGPLLRYDDGECLTFSTFVIPDRNNFVGWGSLYFRSVDEGGFTYTLEHRNGARVIHEGSMKVGEIKEIPGSDGKLHTLYLHSMSPHPLLVIGKDIGD